MEQEFQQLLKLRFSEAEMAQREKLWRCLTETSLQKYFGRDLAIVDIGCGFCEFINSVKGRKKYALDVEASYRVYAADDVEFVKVEPGIAIPLHDCSCDRAFASNFFEHLRSPEALIFVLEEIFRILKPGGKIVVIQPNLALTGGAYWDFFDHTLPLTEKSLLEAMEMVGFKKDHIKRRFLPYTTKGRRLTNPIFLRIYLSIPLLQRIFGKQSLIIAKK